jgi:acyl-CoA reductase-like NAD-dependent aldehyde dehydrogenase
MLYNLLIYENMIGKIRNKLIKQLINKPRFLFSSFIVNNPTTGKPCASFPKYEGNAEMVSEEKVMKEGLAKWKKLNVEERKQKMTQFCDAF